MSTTISGRTARRPSFRFLLAATTACGIALAAAPAASAMAGGGTRGVWMAMVHRGVAPLHARQHPTSGRCVRAAIAGRVAAP